MSPRQRLTLSSQGRLGGTRNPEMREDVAALLGSRTTVPFGPREASGLVQASHAGCALRSTTSCTVCLQEQIHRQATPVPQRGWIQTLHFILPVSWHCCWDSPPPPPAYLFFFWTVKVTAELLCVLRAHRGRNKRPAFLWGTSPSLCCFWLQSSSHHSQHEEGDTGIPESFHLAFPPKKSPIYHSSAQNRTANFFFSPSYLIILRSSRYIYLDLGISFPTWSLTGKNYLCQDPIYQTRWKPWRAINIPPSDSTLRGSTPRFNACTLSLLTAFK